MGHARQARKNRILLTGSFALSIILFLSFSVLIDVVNYVMSQSAAASDLDIFSDEEEKIPAQMVENIRKVDGVKEVGILKVNGAQDSITAEYNKYFALQELTVNVTE